MYYEGVEPEPGPSVHMWQAGHTEVPSSLPDKRRTKVQSDPLTDPDPPSQIVHGAGEGHCKYRRVLRCSNSFVTGETLSSVRLNPRLVSDDRTSLSFALSTF